MGNNNQHVSLPNEKRESIKIVSYQSKHDDIFQKFETYYNLFRYLELKDFQQILYNFNCTSQENSSLGTEKEFNFEIDEVMFNIFIDKKIINHFLINPQIINNEKLVNISKQFYRIIYTNLQKNQSFYIKNISSIGIKSNDVQNKKAIRKIVLLAFAFLYCKAEINEKLLFVYNLFADENGDVSQTSDLQEFLFFLLIIPSNAFIYTIYNLGQEYAEYAILEDKYSEIYKSFEVKDSKYVLNLFLNDMFSSNQKYDFDEFKKKFIEKSWIFTPNGIRKYLEDNNQD